MKKLSTFTPLSEARIIEEADGRSVVAVQIIAPGRSANGRVYESKVLTEAAHLYEGAKVYMDHPTKTEAAQRPERSVRELVGYLESVQPDMGANLVIVKHSDEIMPLIREAIDHNRNLVGLSHNVLADTKITRDRNGVRTEAVQAIRTVKSVDIVTEAAAGGKFKRIIEGGSNMDFETIEELREAYPELLESFKEGVTTELRESLRQEIESKVYGGKDKITEAQRKMEGQFKTLSESIEHLTVENKKLTDALEAKERDGVISGLLTESKLPEVAQKRVRELVEAKTYGTAEELVEATNAAVKSEKEYLSTITEAGKVTGLGGTKQTPDKSQALVEAQRAIEEALGVLDEVKEGSE